MKDRKNLANAGKYDYDKDACDKMANISSFETFSIAIFQLQQKNQRKELKRGATVVRVCAKTASKEAAFKKADEIVALLDAGGVAPKTVKV